MACKRIPLPYIFLRRTAEDKFGIFFVRSRLVAGRKQVIRKVIGRFDIENIDKYRHPVLEHDHLHKTKIGIHMYGSS